MATIITADQGFDETYYLSAKAAQLTASTGQTWTTASTLAAFQAAGLTAAEHYSLYGYNEGLSPNAYYNDSEYAASKAAEAGISADQLRIDWYNASGSTNLYTHYLQYGSFENGVNPSVGFDDDQYYAAKAAHDGTTPAEAEASIQAAGLNAISHYLLYGQYEGLSYTPSASTPGQTYTLTTGVDTFTGGDGNDTFDGTTAGTFNSYDVLNGGGGTNTLLANIGGTTVTTTPTTLANIQNIQLYNSTGTLDLSNTTGVTEIGRSDGAGIVQGLHASTVTLDVTGNVTVGADAYTFTYLNSAVSGTTDAVTLNLMSVGDSVARDTIAVQPTSGLEGIETITVNAQGAVGSYIALGTGTANDTTTINSTGSAALDMTVNTLTTFNHLATYDASTATGDQTVNFDTGTNDLTVHGGAGNDAFTLNAGASTVDGGAGNDTFIFGTNFNSSDTVDGGTGTNTLAWTTSATHTGLTAAEWANVSNIQTVSFTDGVAGANVNQDASLLTGATTFTLDGGVAAGDFTFTNVLSTQDTFNVHGNTGTLSIALQDATGTSDSLTLNMSTATSVGHTLATLNNIAGLETLNITSNGSSGNTITTDNSSATHIISGSAALTLGNVTTATQVDASAMTGALTVGSGTAYSVANGNIIGGSAADTITAGANSQTISGGAGDDTITGGANADILSGGAGADTFVYTTSTDSSLDLLLNNIDKLMDFTSGTDHLDVAVAISGLHQASSLTAVSTGSTTSALATDIASAMTAGGGVYASTDANVLTITGSLGNAGTYLYIDSDNSSGVNDGDLIIQLSGTSSTTLSLNDFS